MLDADEIIPGLWQGSMPPRGSLVSDAGFSVLVLCARDYQPPADDFPGVTKVIFAPNDDDPRTLMARDDLNAARRAAREVVMHLKDGDKVLVTCVAGVNRSGLVVALAIHEFMGCSGKACIDLVRTKRKLIYSIGPRALNNPSFIRVLEKLLERT